MCDRGFCLETPRLLLHHLDTDSDADCQLLVELYYTRGKRTISAVRDYITQNGKTYKHHGLAVYLVSLKPDSSKNASADKETVRQEAPIAFVGMFQRKTVRYPDLGYSILAEHGGKGYATEAGKALLQFVQEQLGEKDVIALTSADNLASQKVLGKIGLVHWGQVKLPDFDVIKHVYVLPGMRDVQVLVETGVNGNGINHGNE